MNHKGKMARCGERPEHKHSGVFMGGVLIMVGAAFMASHLGYLGDLPPWKLWPCILLWGGVAKLASKRFLGGLFLIGIGGVVQAHYLGHLDLEWKMIWPVILILAGLSIFLTSFFKKRKQKATTSDSKLDASVVMGGREEVFGAVEFEGCNISCVMGGLELDLRSARMKGEEVTINVNIVLGGAEIRVPDDWSVEMKGTPLLGGFENKTRGRTGDQATTGHLTIQGSVVMGGIEVRN